MVVVVSDAVVSVVADAVVVTGSALLVPVVAVVVVVVVVDETASHGAVPVSEVMSSGQGCGVTVMVKSATNVVGVVWPAPSWSTVATAVISNSEFVSESSGSTTVTSPVLSTLNGNSLPSAVRRPRPLLLAYWSLYVVATNEPSFKRGLGSCATTVPISAASVIGLYFSPSHGIISSVSAFQIPQVYGDAVVVGFAVVEASFPKCELVVAETSVVASADGAEVVASTGAKVVPQLSIASPSVVDVSSGPAVVVAMASAFVLVVAGLSVVGAAVCVVVAVLVVVLAVLVVVGSAVDVVVVVVVVDDSVGPSVVVLVELNVGVVPDVVDVVVVVVVVDVVVVVVVVDVVVVVVEVELNVAVLDDVVVGPAVVVAVVDVVAVVVDVVVVVVVVVVVDADVVVVVDVVVVAVAPGLTVHALLLLSQVHTASALHCGAACALHRAKSTPSTPTGVVVSATVVVVTTSPATVGATAFVMHVLSVLL